MRRGFFTIAYFLVFWVLIDQAFNYLIHVFDISATNLLVNLAVLLCLVAALSLSFGLTDKTVKAITDKYSKK